MMSKKMVSVILISTIFTYSCTKLNETVGGNLTPGQVAADSSAAILLRGVYTSLTPTFMDPGGVLALSDFSTDEAIAPTRGSDWDDNGSWRAFHEHKWNDINSHIQGCFTQLGGTIYAATDMLRYKPNTLQQAEARFIRAFAMYWLLDLFDQVPYREPGENLIQPAKVRKGLDALNFIIREVDAVEPDLRPGPPNKANQYAAKVLLMKCYLNKAVYKNRFASSYTFDPLDMDTVISLADEIIKNGPFKFSQNYFLNFAPDNGTNPNSKENIFTQAGKADGFFTVGSSWESVLHYTQGGWNGFTTLSDFYNKFDSTDKRRGIVYDYSNSPPNPGRHVNVGFLIDQQYDLGNGDMLYGNDGYGNNVPLIFTAEVTNIEPGPNVQMSGIRPIKYPPDFENFNPSNSPATNEFVYFRFPDVLLMKAEAIRRGGTPTSAGPYGSTALEIVNSIRTDPSRGAPKLVSINDSILLDERGRELWWENWRRQDMIRSGTFLKPFQEKKYPSDQKCLLFPIPADQVALNPNLVQNRGY